MASMFNSEPKPIHFVSSTFYDSLFSEEHILHSRFKPQLTAPQWGHFQIIVQNKKCCLETQPARQLVSTTLREGWGAAQPE